MKLTKMRRILILLAVLSLVIAACAPAEQATPTAVPATDEPTEEVVETEEVAEEDATEEVEATEEPTEDVEDVEATEEPTEDVEDVEATEEPTEDVEDVEATEEPTEDVEDVEATEEVEVAMATEEPTDEVEDVEATEEPTEEVEDVEATEEPTEEVEDVEATEEPTEEVEDVEATEEPTEEVEDVEATEEPTEEVEDVEMAENAVYEGRFTFEYPANFELAEGTDITRLSDDGSTVLVSGPDNYALVIGSVEFDSVDEALAFFVDRSGYTAGDAVEADIPTVEVSLPRRGQTGLARQIDLGNGRTGVVISLAPEGAEADVEDAATTVISTLEYPADLVDVAVNTEGFSTLVAAVQAAGLEDTLRSSEYTVFAPTDEAFEAALESLDLTAEELLADTELLTSILQYHVVDGTVLAEAVVELDGQEVATLNGATVTVTVTDDGVVLNDTVNVIQTDVTAYNGVIHVIDAVLVPPMEEAEEDTTEEVVEEDAEEETSEEETADAESVGTIVEVATDDVDNFSTLVAAVVAADLFDALNGEDEYTVFAPTNDAFAETLETLGLSAEELLADTDVLTDILQYHVVEGIVMAEDIADGDTFTTLNGDDITVTVTDDGVVLNDTVNVVTTDVVADNGVIHVIDEVLLPPSDE